MNSLKTYCQIILIYACFVLEVSTQNLEKILNQNKTVVNSFHIQPRSDTSRFGSGVELGDLPHHVLIFTLYNAEKDIYRAFCAGSIIGDDKVLTSANCFLTNRKAHRRDYDKVWVVAGIIQVSVKRSAGNDNIQQWRQIVKIYSQRFYRFPAYNLGVLIMNLPWIFNNYVNKIPYESEDHDFDGICIATAVKATKSWSINKYVFVEEVEMIKRRTCEQILQRSCRLYFCTACENGFKYAYSFESEGSGLICYETGDPNEKDPRRGILVGVTSKVNIGLPNLHMRIGAYSKWVTDLGCKLKYNKILIFCVVTIGTNIL
ncbi:unnamed protein product [Arctia plantaginis]|uniref:Peptidase S1 domain-containing protein n=1 Tax=Arctia plantaginis TaxID=874455 RepID=A0A8S1B025_ARCPL|nr:unnamed protein product [Arctia plantaginis]